MEKITDYQLVTAKDPSKLTEEVKKEMKNGGWEPLGAPVVMDRGFPNLVQAMVIYKRGGP